MADVFRQHGQAYRSARAVPWAHLKIMNTIEMCRTAAMGGHKESCTTCGAARYAYSSCRNRHCPKCQTLTKAQWVEDRKTELLPVPYFHGVFTLPHDLNPLVLCNKAILLRTLFSAASQTLLEFGRNNLGGKMGFTMVLHTWDQLLRPHFHVHCVIPAGALATDRTRWIHGNCRFLFPVKALGKVFRAKFLDELQSLHRRGELSFPTPVAELALDDAFNNLIQRLRAISWVVYAKRPFAGPEQVLSYLGRYTHRVAISNHRILDVTDADVTFTYRNRRAGDQKRTATISGEEFIRRFLLHVLPKGFKRIRHYGFLGSRSKSVELDRCRRLLGQAAPVQPRRKLSVGEWMLELTGTDIDRCPSCGKRSLIRTRVYPHTQESKPVVSRDTS